MMILCVCVCHLRIFLYKLTFVSVVFYLVRFSQVFNTASLQNSTTSHNAQPDTPLCAESGLAQAGCSELLQLENLGLVLFSYTYFKWFINN